MRPGAEILGTAKALSFDCYGTLIDWEAGLLAQLRPWAARQAAAIDDDGLLAAYGSMEAELERSQPRLRYSEILRLAHAELGRRLNLASTAAEAEAFARSVGDWPAFPDTAAALRVLSESYALVVVSNVDAQSFAGTRPRLGADLAALVTAEEAGAYKPDARVFELALERLAGLGIAKGEIVHVAQSLYHDHEPAQRLGLRTVWVDRRAGRPGWGATPAPALGVRPDLTVTSLEELARLASASRPA